MKKYFVIKSILLLCLLMAGMGSVWAQQDTVYTKWKRTSLADLQSGDRVVIVDLNKAVAISNDKGSSKAPEAVSVELNDAQYRITGEVADNVQWNVTATEAGYKFQKPDSESDFLYGDSSKGLRVGTGADNEFDLLNNFLHIELADANYYVGLKDSFMSSSWALLAEDNGEIDNSIRKTQIAFFKKVETTAQDIEMSFLSKDYQCDSRGTHYYSWFSLDENISCPEEISDLITFTSSNNDVADITKLYGDMCFITKLGHSGVATITAYFPGLVTDDVEYDDAYATCTVRVEDSNSQVKGISFYNPLTVNEAIELAKTEGRVEDGTCYYIKGKVSKVNSGLMALFSEFGLDELLGDMDLDLDFDFDMDAMGSGGIAIPGLGNSETMTYYISDYATKENQMKVTNGYGLVINSDIVDYIANCDVRFGTIENNQLSPGDDVLIYGPLIYSEDSNLLGGLFGGGESEEPKKSVKVDELNYINSMNKQLMALDMTMYVNESKTLDELYYITSIPEGTVDSISVKSSDTDIAAWVKNEEGTDSVFTALKEGKAKITVKVRVTLAEDDPNTEEDEGQCYMMKRKFNLEVITRDVEPLGKNDGDYVLVHNVGELYDGDRLILVGTNVTDDEEKNFAMVSDDAMMGGGKSGKAVTVDNEELSDIPGEALEITLERDTVDTDIWYLNVGTNDNGEKLYLYASDNSSDDEEPSGGDDESGFDITKFLELFGGSTGLKVGTKEAAGDSCQVSLAISNEGATIKFNVPGKKNSLRMGNAMDALMEMFGSFMNQESEDEEPTQESGNETSFNFFMANFNCYAEDDEKGILPKIYHFVPADEFEIYISEIHWTTLNSEYDLLLPEAENDKLAVYEVTGINYTSNILVLQLNEVENVKAHVPYLVKGVNRDGTFTLRRAPLPSDSIMRDELSVNLLQISDSTTCDGAYLLGDQDGRAAMLRSNYGKIGSGHVYLPEDVVTNGAAYVLLEYLLGDVNGDGSVNAADVTALYNFMLEGDSSGIVNGDQNGDGIISTNDVTIVYNVILGRKK